MIENRTTSPEASFFKQMLEEAGVTQLGENQFAVMVGELQHVGPLATIMELAHGRLTWPAEPAGNWPDEIAHH